MDMDDGCQGIARVTASGSPQHKTQHHCKHWGLTLPLVTSIGVALSVHAQHSWPKPLPQLDAGSLVCFHMASKSAPLWAGTATGKCVLYQAS